LDEEGRIGFYHGIDCRCGFCLRHEEEKETRTNTRFEKTCPECGQAFKTKFQYQKYCNVICRWRRNSRAFVNQHRTEVNDRNRRHYQLASRTPRGRNMIFAFHCLLETQKERVCEGCGTHFRITGVHLNQKYCTVRCRKISQDRKRTGRNVMPQPDRKQKQGICALCGEKFVGFAIQKFCSYSCASKWSSFVRRAVHLGKSHASLRVLQSIMERDKRCVYCGAETNLTLDHVVPLKKGGSIGSDNLVLSCLSCNSSKGTKDVIEWCKIRGIQVPQIVMSLIRKSTTDAGSNEPRHLVACLRRILSSMKHSEWFRK